MSAHRRADASRGEHMRLDWDQAVAIGTLIGCGRAGRSVSLSRCCAWPGASAGSSAGPVRHPRPRLRPAGRALRPGRHGGRSRRHPVEPQRGVPPDRRPGAKAASQRRRAGGGAPGRSRRGTPPREIRRGRDLTAIRSGPGLPFTIPAFDGTVAAETGAPPPVGRSPRNSGRPGPLFRTMRSVVRAGLLPVTLDVLRFLFVQVRSSFRARPCTWRSSSSLAEAPGCRGVRPVG